MMNWLELLRDLVLLRRGPQDLPYSQALFGIALIAAIALDVAAEYVFPLNKPQPVATRMAIASVSALLLVGLPYVLLRLRGVGERFVQTGTALLLTGMVVTLMTLPGRLMIGPLPEDASQATRTQALGSLLVLCLLGWLLLIYGHILRHALDQRLGVGVLLALAFGIVQAGVLQVIFGGAST